MRDHADPLHNFIESTRKYCSLLSSLVGGLIPKICTVLVGSERKNHLMAAMDPIDISSSDSEVDDWDVDNSGELDAPLPRESSTSNNHRILPLWATTSGPSLTGRGGSSQNVLSLRRAPASNGSSLNFNHNPPAKLMMRPISGDNVNSNHFTGYGRGESSQNIPSFRRAQVSNGSSLNFYHNPPAKLEMRPISSDNETILSSHITNDNNSNHFTGNDFEKHSAHLASKRSLPISLLPSVSNARSSYVDGQPHPSWSNPSYGTNYKKEHFGMGSDDVVMYEKIGSRVLPPSLMHAKSVPATQHASSSDPVYRPGVAEERAGENDERLVYQAALQELNQSKVEATLPDGLLSVSLLRHQKIALAWMLQKETSSLHCSGGILADDQGLGKTISMIALIQMQKSTQSKSKPEDQCNVKAEALNLDDDDDGDDNKKAKVEASTSIREFQTRRPAAGTLVVCPASVLRQWARELDEKVTVEAKLSVLVYHGSNRTKDPIELAKYDVVLTTYAIVMNEVPKQVDDEDEDKVNGERYGLSSEFSTTKKRKKVSNPSKKGKKGRKGMDSSAIDYSSGALARVGWFRVILDEAQTIKNHRTQMARACCGLRAKRRWCLSGTPIQNAIDELFSYFRFLRYDPYATFKSFCNTIKIPISRNSVQGYKKLQAVLRAIMLRRTKGTFIDGEPIINLPPKTINLAKVDFSDEERDFYNKLEADSRSQFKAYAAAGTVSQNYANILLMLLRLRQACDHPLLVKGFGSDSVERLSGQMAKRVPRDILINLLNLLQTNVAICRVCNDPPEDAVITTCGHVFCYQCVSEYLQGDDHTCPSLKCKEQLSADAVFSEATLRSCISVDADGDPSSSSGSAETSIVLQNEYSSSKVRAAMEILQSHCKAKSSISEMDNLVQQNGNSQTDGPIKAIVFSQWTRMLDLIELSLKRSCLQYRRLDGTMSLPARDRAVKEFNTDPEVTVMLMSLKAGNLGLNMVAASHVILLDLWWNPTTEDQAVDRAHRIGQTRPVIVSRITIKDTVEDRILALQEEKRKMVASAFGEDHSGGSATRLTVEDLKYLFML